MTANSAIIQFWANKLFILIFIQQFISLYNNIFQSHLMKQQKLNGKDNHNFNQKSASSLSRMPNLDPKLQKSVVTLTDIDVLQQFYLTQMLSIYLKNEKNYPNPHQILQCLRARQRKSEQNEKSLTIYRQYFKQNQSSSKSEGKTEESQNNKKLEEKVRKRIKQEYSKIRFKYLTILEENLNSSQFFIKYSLVQNENILNFILQSFTQIMRKHKADYKNAEEKWKERQRKKIIYFQDKLQKQGKIKIQQISKLNMKIKQLQEQHRVYKEEYKRTQKQKNELHSQIYKNHQQIIQKSNIIEKLRERIEQNFKTIESLQIVVEANKKLLSKYENQISQISLSKMDWQQRIKEYGTNYSKLEEENQKLRKKVQQQLNYKLTKIKSQQHLLSTNKISSSLIQAPYIQEKYSVNKNMTTNSIKRSKYSEISSSESQNFRLKEDAKKLEEKLLEKDRLLKEQREQWAKRERSRLEKIIQDWRQKLQKLIEQNDIECNLKDHLILNLQNEIKQLRKQIKLNNDCVHIKRNSQKENEEFGKENE